MRRHETGLTGVLKGWTVLAARSARSAHHGRMEQFRQVEGRILARFLFDRRPLAARDRPRRGRLTARRAAGRAATATGGGCGGPHGVQVTGVVRWVASGAGAVALPFDVVSCSTRMTIDVPYIVL